MCSLSGLCPSQLAHTDVLEMLNLVLLLSFIYFLTVSFFSPHLVRFSEDIFSRGSAPLSQLLFWTLSVSVTVNKVHLLNVYTFSTLAWIVVASDHPEDTPSIQSPRYNVAFFTFFLLKQGTLWGCRQTHSLTLVSMFSIHSACLHVTMITVNRTSPSALWVHTSTPIRSLSDIPKVHLLLWKHNKTEKLKKKNCARVSADGL